MSFCLVSSFHHLSHLFIFSPLISSSRLVSSSVLLWFFWSISSCLVLSPMSLSHLYLISSPFFGSSLFGSSPYLHFISSSLVLSLLALAPLLLALLVLSHHLFSSWLLSRLHFISFSLCSPRVISYQQVSFCLLFSLFSSSCLLVFLFSNPISNVVISSPFFVMSSSHHQYPFPFPHLFLFHIACFQLCSSCHLTSAFSISFPVVSVRLFIRLLSFSCCSRSFSSPLTSCLPVNKSCSSLRWLCPWLLSPCGLWKVQNCHCLQTVLCTTSPCQHSFFGLNLASLYFLSTLWSGLISLSLSHTHVSHHLSWLQLFPQLPS